MKEEIRMNRMKRVLAKLCLFVGVFICVAGVFLDKNTLAEEESYFDIEIWGEIFSTDNGRNVCDSKQLFGIDYYEIPYVYLYSEGNAYDELELNVDFVFAFYMDGKKVTNVEKIGVYQLVITGKGNYASYGDIYTINIGITSSETDLRNLFIYHEGKEVCDILDIGYNVQEEYDFYRHIAYDGKSHNAIPAVFSGETIDDENIYLKNGVDFIYAYYKGDEVVKEVKEEGEYRLVIKGIGFYTGTVTIGVVIEKQSISKYYIEIGNWLFENGEKVEYEYADFSTADTLKPRIYKQKLMLNADYECAIYKNGKKINFKGNVGTYTVIAKGKGKYKGEIKAEFTIKKSQISKSKVNIFYRNTFEYNGKKFIPTVNLKLYANNVVLKKGKDYVISNSKKQKNIGNYTITIKGKGGYKGTVKLQWRIIPQKLEFSMKSSNNEIKVTPKLNKNITGYQIEYGLMQNWDLGKTEKVTVLKKQKTKLLPTNYVNGAKVYVRIRAYKTVKGKKIYSEWSNKKSIRVKGPVKSYY